VLDTYRRERVSAGDHLETFIDTLRRMGLEPFKAAAHNVRFAPSEDAAQEVA
jgi:sulfite reductase (NADPH) hemoprotein beta-component